MSVQFSPTIEQAKAALRLRPNFSEIARDLGVTPQHVRRVFWGLSTSARVSKAIHKSVQKKARQKNMLKTVAA
ncbi:hypothetical protein ACFQBQ_07695 [Granulicella cerasi]|uniref:Uncharacterized protein n=1 Tax=Granulicella cerasi TaxID=741063 RepID=A0ABW1ZAL7_9BACT|nr:hypothetical protein [Granulicella cerasi]